jgi:hypothetical protein
MSRPVRVRKARRRSLCPLCRGTIRIGEQVVLAPGLDWAHSRCWLAAPMTAHLGSDHGE